MTTGVPYKTACMVSTLQGNYLRLLMMGYDRTAVQTMDTNISFWKTPFVFVFPLPPAIICHCPPRAPDGVSSSIRVVDVIA